MSAKIYTPGLRAALYRALPTPLAPASLTPTLTRTRTLAPRPAAPAHLTQAHPFTTARPHRRRREGAPFGSVNKAASPATSDEPIPANPHIDAPTVMIAEPGKGLKGPFRTAQVVRSLNPATHTLRVVASADAESPICRIFDLRAEEELRLSREAREKENEKKKSKYKIIEIGWGIAGNDLAMKMERMRRFLEDGCRVEVVLLSKKRAKRPGAAECEELVANVREALGAIPGATESKPADGQPGKTMQLFVEKVEKKKD